MLQIRVDRLSIRAHVNSLRFKAPDQGDAMELAYLLGLGAMGRRWLARDCLSRTSLPDFNRNIHAKHSAQVIFLAWARQ